MITFRKLRFSPSFDPFLVLNQPLFKAFWDFPWAKTRHHGLKMGPNHLFEHPEWSRITFGNKRVFHPFLTHCWSQNGPFSRHFGIFRGP